MYLVFFCIKFYKCIFVFSSRGGLRATAGGRLGWSTNNAQTLSKKPFSDWSLEVLCVWMDSLGLGMYNTDLKKLVNHGDQLAKMSMTDLEHKLGIKSPMHRKKLVLGMKVIWLVKFSGEV